MFDKIYFESYQELSASRSQSDGRIPPRSAALQEAVLTRGRGL